MAPRNVNVQRGRSHQISFVVGTLASASRSQALPTLVLAGIITVRPFREE
jgi:hypothetical protein